MSNKEWDTFLPKMADSMPSLHVLDDSCRCSVCKEYLQGPMMTLCGHTFCSLCIRRALNSDGRCPTCRSLEEESKLRKNLMIEEIVEAFLPFRLSLMEYAPCIPEVPVTDANNHVTDLVGQAESMNGNVRSASPRSRQSIRTRSVTASSHRDWPQVDDQKDDRPPGHVTCPVCQKSIHQDKVEYHVNRCLEGKSSPSEPPETQHNGLHSQYFHTDTLGPSRSNSPRASRDSSDHASSNSIPMRRLPKLSYNAMTDARLRKTMLDMGISSSGNRAQLQRRCTEFTTMWNSNLDSKTPKTKRDLLHDMRNWDRAQAISTQKFTNEEIDNAHEHGKFDDTFVDLVSQARASMKRKAEAVAGQKEHVSGQNGPEKRLHLDEEM